MSAIKTRSEMIFNDDTLGQIKKAMLDPDRAICGIDSGAQTKEMLVGAMLALAEANDHLYKQLLYMASRQVSAYKISADEAGNLSLKEAGV